MCFHASQSGDFVQLRGLKHPSCLNRALVMMSKYIWCACPPSNTQPRIKKNILDLDKRNPCTENRDFSIDSTHCMTRITISCMNYGKISSMYEMVKEQPELPPGLGSLLSLNLIVGLTQTELGRVTCRLARGPGQIRGGTCR